MAGTEFHVSYPRMKHEENSPQGDIEAHRRGFRGTDHDQQKGASGIGYNTHWKDIWHRDHFVDPLGQYGPGTPHGPVPFDKLPDQVIRRVVAHSHGKEYRIRTTIAGITHAGHVGLAYDEVELKPGNVWTLADILSYKRAAKKAGIRLVIKSMDNWKGWMKVRALCVVAGVRFRRIRMG